MSYTASSYNYATPLSGAKRLIGQKLTGVQMFDIDAAEVGFLDASDPYVLLPPDSDNLTSEYIPVLPNTTYTYSYWGFGSGIEAWTGWYYYNASQVVIGERQTERDVWDGIQTVTFKTPSNCYYLRIGSRYLSRQGVYVMLNVGSEVLPWEPYNDLEAYPPTRKFFTLDDNVLDGSYYPVTCDVGIWSADAADESGSLATPFVVTITEDLQVNSYVVAGSTDCYPVAFTVEFYEDDTLLYTISETENTDYEHTYHLPSTIHVTSIVVTVTKISKANAAARLYSLHGLLHVSRVDTLNIRADGVGAASPVYIVAGYDRLQVKPVEARTRVLNTINVTSDTLRIVNDGVATPTNVHTKMKAPSRRIYGRVYITYTDPMLDSESTVESTPAAYNSSIEQISDGVTTTNGKFFTLYENDLTGNYVVSDQYSQVGFVSSNVSDYTGAFAEPFPYVKHSFSARPVVNFSVIFDSSRGAIPTDFDIVYTKSSGATIVKAFSQNTESIINIPENVADVVSVAVVVKKLSKAGYPVGILEMPVASTILYAGYDDRSDLMSIDLLEELTYEDDVEALGGVSANEVTIVLDNSTKAFYFNNANSIVAKHLKRNRKIVPWLGTEVEPGKIEWYTLGTFWAYRWDVPVGSLTAKVTAFDTIGLLDTTSFSDHQMQVNKTVYDLVKYVLDDAKKMFYFLEYDIDESLKDVVVPYAWFSAASHTAALRKISGCFPMHIYCDRAGRICAAPQKLHLDYYYDTWSDSTNVISKSYNSLYTTLPNIVNVNVYRPVVLTEQSLAKDALDFSVGAVQTRTLNFSKPYVGDLQVTVDCDDTVSYTYDVYSWGATFVFSGTGDVRSIECIGTALDISNSSVVTQRDNDSVRLNGAITRDIASDFIQTSTHAALLINRLISLAANDKYDAEVTYRGDIALSINDPIRLLDGIAPDNRYNIKRHQLFWDGALHGIANLNT